MLGPFTPLPPEELKRLIRRGAEAARELDRHIGHLFSPGPWDLALVLDAPKGGAR